MSKKIFKPSEVKGEVKTLHIHNYGDVETGEKVFRLDKLAEVDAEAGEVLFRSVGFDDEVAHGAKVTGNRRVLRPSGEYVEEKFEVEDFSKDSSDVLNSSDTKSPASGSDDGFVEDNFQEPEAPSVSEEEMAKAVQEARDGGFVDGKKAGYDEGYAKGLEDGKAQAHKDYEAQKADYLNRLEAIYSQVLAETAKYADAVKSLDDNLPELVLGFLDELVGVERKINRKLVVSIIQNNLDVLMNLTSVKFRVNPADAEEMRKAFPEQETVEDSLIELGGVKIDTSIGEMDYTLETILGNFEKQIYEELESPEEDS